MKSKDEHMHLVAQYLSGHASQDEVDQLERLMLGDPQLREDFIRYAKVEAALPASISSGATFIPFEKPEKRGLNQKWATAAAAAIVIGLFTLYQSQQSSPQPVAEFTKLENVRWLNSNFNTENGASILPGQRIELSSGQAEVLFNSGAKVTITGPSILEVRGENDSFLVLGNADVIAEAPESKGFTIETPSSTFVDISTAFTATVAMDGLSRLQVTEGAVDVIVNRGDSAKRFATGETLYIEPGDNKILTRIEPGCGTSQFKFPSIESPSNDDYADASYGNVKMIPLDSTPHSNSGSLDILLNGRAQTQQDSPRESYFCLLPQQHSFVIDLGKAIDIAKVNSFTWHQHKFIKEHRHRAQQRFTLFAYAGDEVPIIAPTKENHNGWQRIARVNSDNFFRVKEDLDRPAQQATSITGSKGSIGYYRYLLIQSHPFTFFGEIDVYQVD